MRMPENEYRGKEMSKSDKKKLTWEYSYILGITIIICILAAFINKATLPITAIIFLVALAVIILLWMKPLSKNVLYMLNVLNSLASVSLASLLITLLINNVDSMIAVISATVVSDVFSFTKKGKSTANARLANNNNTLARLSICLPVPGKQGLLPLIGVGDLYFYSIILFFSLHIFGAYIVGKVFLLIIAGQLANIILIAMIKDKTWYRGFPATLCPGIFYLAFLFIQSVAYKL